MMKASVRAPVLSKVRVLPTPVNITGLKVMTELHPDIWFSFLLLPKNVIKYVSFVALHHLGNIFYLMEYREIFLTLLRKYDETKQPHSYLKDLVESTHLFLRMLERFCKGRKNLMVQVSSCIFFAGVCTFLPSDPP